MMFGGSDRDRSWSGGDRGRDEDRGFFDRMGERASEWFGGESERVLASLGGQVPGTVIVMGVRRGGGLLGPQPGSTAYRVLSLSHVPVLVVPARLR